MDQFDITFSEDQFAQVVDDWAITDKTRNYLFSVIVLGQDHKATANELGLNMRYAYKAISRFKERTLHVLSRSNRRLQINVVFEQIQSTE